MFTNLKVGDTVTVCTLSSKNTKLTHKAVVDKVTNIIELKLFLDVSRTFKFDLITGKQINSDVYWLEQ
jgi:hypothetical protein